MRFLDLELILIIVEQKVLEFCGHLGGDFTLPFFVIVEFDVGFESVLIIELMLKVLEHVANTHFDLTLISNQLLKIIETSPRLRVKLKVLRQTQT